MKMNFLVLILLVFFVCNEDSNENIRISKEIETIEKLTTPDSLLTPGQRKVLNGAKLTLRHGYEYDMTMGYYITEYNDKGQYIGERVFPGGDINPDIGVCTDVIIRALRLGEVIDLQKALNEDIKKAVKDYPMHRWGSKKPDPNIDQRRVMNLEVWFGKYWTQLNTEGDWQPGDIVVWDMAKSGNSDHIGIVSDKIVNGRYWVIHNHPDPGFVAEEDKLFYRKISGHYRIKE